MDSGGTHLICRAVAHRTAGTNDVRAQSDADALRNQPGGDYVYGSLSVLQALLRNGLIDEFVLMIEPITLGGGKTLFPSDGDARKFELISAQAAKTRVQICRYRPRR